MHERGPVGMLVERLIDETRGSDVSDVRILIAPDVIVDVAAQAWSSAVEGTPLESARVAWIEVDPHLRCLTCGDDYRGGRLDPCPSCGGVGLVIESIATVELDTWSVTGSTRTAH